MGRMVDGEWIDQETLDSSDDGRFKREETTLRSWVTRDGSPGPTGEGGFAAESDRYHLFVALNCPWAHRTLIFRVLKRLESHISISVAAPRRTEQGWVFEVDGPYSDPLLGAQALHEVYRAGVPNYSGRVTVPVLWDKERQTIVSNESAEIIRMLNDAFVDIAPTTKDYYPEELRPEIDRLNERIYRTVNNGVYRAGFARTQEAYDEAFDELFETLDALELRLGRTRYLVGDRQTEADWRLFPTLARFDVAYHYAFKCNLRRLLDYPNLWRYARELYHVDGIAQTVDFDIYKRGYHSKSELRNPLGIVPGGPAIDWSLPDE